MRRVVVTGLGMVTPLASGVEESWRRLLAGESGIRKITSFDCHDLACKIAGQLPRTRSDGGNYDPLEWMETKDLRRVDDFIVFAMAAATQALDDANWHPESYEDQTNTGVIIGSGIGGLSGINEAFLNFAEFGPKKISPFFISGRLINMASGYISIRFGLKGPNHAVVTACSTGSHAIGDAARMIMMGDADVMVAGGTESGVNRPGIASFVACRALSTAYNDTPSAASRPFDEGRDGFVMGEGAGCVVLEEYDHALARGAKIYAELIGYGLSGDAYHITSPPPDGDGAYRSMMAALKRANITPDQIDYINAHGTSTPTGDNIELRAVERFLTSGQHNGQRSSTEPVVSNGDAGMITTSMSSTKSSTGHLLGAAGAVETIFSILALRDQIAPATLNLETPCFDTFIDLVPKTPKPRKIDYVLSNSFGFGGTNVSLLFTKPELYA